MTVIITTEKVKYINLGKDFSNTVNFYNGKNFYNRFLHSNFDNYKLVICLDDIEVYTALFFVEAFKELVEKHGSKKVLEKVAFISQNKLYLP